MDDKENLTPEDLEAIARLQEQKDSEHTYTPRPKFQRVMAYTLCGIVVVGILLWCYWMIVS